MEADLLLALLLLLPLPSHRVNSMYHVNSTDRTSGMMSEWPKTAARDAVSAFIEHS